ncbi:hypothetical protein U1Q18_010359 [Sarracenia purpurea var. burkii]
MASSSTSWVLISSSFLARAAMLMSRARWFNFLRREERLVWPMRIWATGYDLWCVLSLLLLFGQYGIFHRGQEDGFNHPDLE